VQPSSAARSVAPHPDPAPRRQELLPVGRGSDDPSDPTAPRAPDVAAIASGAVETPARDPRLSAPERENLLAAYLHTIRERVASHRRYPHSARRLGLEGTIRVQFHVDQCGDVSGMSLVIPSQHQLLRDASIEAIRASVPFPTPPKELGNGLDVEVSIVFRLGE
jgi:protein TonB